MTLFDRDLRERLKDPKFRRAFRRELWKIRIQQFWWKVWR